jgi:hypothetical protein
MRIKTPQNASIDEVRITRAGEIAAANSQLIIKRSLILPPRPDEVKQLMDIGRAISPLSRPSV